MKRCLQCHEMFEPSRICGLGQHKYCSIGCQRAWWRNHSSRPQVVCAGCGKTFIPWRLDCVTFCSRECSYEFKSTHRNPNPVPKHKLCKIYVKRCCECNSVFVARQPAARTCSAHCRVQWLRRLWTEKAIQHDDRDRRPRDCAECGKSFVPMYGDKLRKFCSGKCMKKHTGRMSKATRRARKRAGIVDSIDPIAVFQRDGWRCQLCGLKTPRARRGTIHPDAPELDHIVPLALGGDHVWHNVQCACRKCNSEKGASARGQLLLAM